MNVFYEKKAWGTSYNGQLGEVPPERDTFLKHQVYAVKIRFFVRGGGLCSQAQCSTGGSWYMKVGAWNQSLVKVCERNYLCKFLI